MMLSINLLLVIVISLCIGSFLNVIIYRYPLMLFASWRQEAYEYLELTDKQPHKAINLCLPRSHCPKCQQQIRIIDNIPILSFIINKRRCHFCHQPISWRYPMIELASMLISIGLYYQFGLSLAFYASCLYSYGLIVLFMIDADHQLLPDTIVISLLWLGLLVNSQSLFTHLNDAVFGAAMGYSMLWVIAKLYHIVRKREGMGHGDFKMLAMIGAWSGLTAIPLSLLIACILSIIVNGVLMVCKRIHLQQATPFGPYLAVAALMILLWQQPISLAFAKLLGFS